MKQYKQSTMVNAVSSLVLAFVMALVVMTILLGLNGVAAVDTCETTDTFQIQSAIVNEALLKMRSGSWSQTNSFIPGNPASPMDPKAGGFLFSHSYLPLEQTQINEGVPAQYYLTPSTDGYMSRFAFRLMYGQVSNSSGVNGSQSAFVTQQSIYVVAPKPLSATSSSSQACLTQSTRCNYDEGEVCELIQPLQIDIRLEWPISAKFRMQPVSYVPSSGLSASSSNQQANTLFPYAYIQLEGPTSSSDECTAQDPSFEGAICLGASTCNGMVDCQGPPANINQTEVDELMETHCGSFTDPWDEPLSNWHDDLNPSCLTACCNADNLWYQRWGLGKRCRLYNLSDFKLTTPSLTVTVTTTLNNGTTRSYNLTATDLDMGVFSIIPPDPSSSDQSVNLRLSIQKTYALPTAAIQQMSGGKIVVCGEWDGAAKVPTVVSTLTQAQLEGVAATANWAYIQPGAQTSAGWSNLNNGMLQGQATITSAARGFGKVGNCPSTSTPPGSTFYSDFYNVPGWYVDPKTDLVYAVSPCQMMDNLNHLAYNLTNDPAFKNQVNQDSLCLFEQRSLSPYMAPGCSVITPNCVLQEADGIFQRMLLTPGCGQSEVGAVEMYLDISTNFAPYIGLSGTVGLMKPGSGCGYNFFPLNITAPTASISHSVSSSISPTPSTSRTPSPSPNTRGKSMGGQGRMIITLENPTNLTGHYIMLTSCSASAINSTGPEIQWSVAPVGSSGNTTSPNYLLINVPPNNHILSPEINFSLQPIQGTYASAGDSNLKITCTVTVYDNSTFNLPNSKPMIQTTLTCSNLTNEVFIPGKSHVTVVPTPQPCTFSLMVKGECTDEGVRQVLFYTIIVVVSVLVFAAIGGFIIYASTKGKKKQEEKRQEELNQE